MEPTLGMTMTTMTMMMIVGNWVEATLTYMHYTLIEKDHLGDRSPEKDFTNLEQTALNRCQPLPYLTNVYSTGNNNTLFIIHFTIHLFA